MLQLTTQHLLSGKELNQTDMHQLFDLTLSLKTHRNLQYHTILAGKQLALIFDKPSLRTRFSFIGAINQLGGHAIESTADTRKEEDPRDLIRVLQGYCDGVLVRTHSDTFIEKMTTEAAIPIINGLSHYYHPCQILADLFTLREKFEDLTGLTISFIGDGNNILHSLLLMAPQLGINIRYCCPENYQPNDNILDIATKRHGDFITSCSLPSEAVLESDAVYTDVWTSMGCDARDDTFFDGFQVNEELMRKAKPHAVFMHCMPMVRGKEVSQDLPDANCSVIFQQSENRLHIQKALLIGLLK